MADQNDYVPPKVWSWDKESGGRFANINRPIAGPTHDKDLPVGKHPLQLYSLGTPKSTPIRTARSRRSSIAAATRRSGCSNRARS